MQLKFNLGLKMILSAFSTLHFSNEPNIAILRPLGDYLWDFLEITGYKIDDEMTLTSHAKIYNKESKRIG